MKEATASIVRWGIGRSPQRPATSSRRLRGARSQSMILYCTGFRSVLLTYFHKQPSFLKTD